MKTSLTCGVKMILLCHSWGWQPPQTAFLIHIRHIHSVWAHWYAVHWHMVAALHSYIPRTWLRIWGSGSLWVSKWCYYVIVEADSHLKLLLASILDIYTVFEHIDILSIGIQLQPYTVIPLGFWVTCGVKMMSLRHSWGYQQSQTASCIHIRHIYSAWAHWYAVHRHMVADLHSLPT